MADLDSRLSYRDGFLCIEFLSPDTATPTIEVLYWPIRRASLSEAKALPLGAAARHISAGRYAIALPDGVHELRLLNGPRTIPIRRERRNLPKPRGKVRWENGKWEKL